MKKIFTLLLVFVSIFVLAACGGNHVDLDKVLSEIQIPSSVTENFDLPKQVGEVQITWSSDKAQSISVQNQDDSNYLASVTRQDDDVTVKLTATATHEDNSKNRTIDVIVVKKEVVPVSSFTVTFNVDGQTFTTVTLNENETVDIPNTEPVKEGHTFEDWYLGDVVYDFSQTVTSNLTLEAHFNINTYEVIFIDEDEKELSRSSFEYGSIIEKPEQPSKTGYNFVGWYLDDVEFEFPAHANANITLQAKYEVQTYTATFNNENGELYRTVTHNHDSKIIVPTAPAKAGHSFVKWQLDGEDFDFNQIVNENIGAFSPVYEIDTYNVQFYVDGILHKSVPVTYLGNTESIAAPEIDHQTFVSWQYNGQAFDFSKPITNHLKLHALYKAEQVLVTVIANDSHVVEAFEVDYDSQLDIHSDSLYIINYGISGIYTDAELTTAYDFQANITAPITIYVVYVELTDQEKITNAGAHLESLTLVPVQNKLTLPTKGRHNTTITWSTSDTSVLTSQGYILPPQIGKGEVDITLTASIRGVRGTTPESVFVYYLVDEYQGVQDITSVLDLPYTNLTTEYNIADGHLRTYFPDFTAVPYVDIRSFLNLLGTGSISESELKEDQINGLLYAEEIEYLFSDSILVMSYDVTYEDEDEGTKTYTYTLELDFINNTIKTDNMSFFSNYVKSTSTNYSLGISYLDSYREEGEPLVFRLNDYRLDIALYEEGGTTKFLMPFHLANQLFVGSTYFNTYYNGDGYFGIYAMPAQTSEEMAIIRNSTLNSKAIDNSMKLYHYDHTAFVFDHFYGLKNDRNVETYYDILVNYQADLFSTLGTTVSNSMFEFINKGLDDLHSSFRFAGYYTNPSFTIPLTSTSQLGPIVNQWYTVLWAIQDAIEARWGAGKDPESYRILEDGKTAVIYLDGFVTATSAELLEDPNAFDSDIYFQETLDAIFEKAPHVENIVVDLSYNTGGNLGALLRVLGYITDQPIQMSYQDPLEGANDTYFAVVENYRYDKDSRGNYILDSEGNRQISKDANGNNIIVAPREDINWFFLTSKVTFSAANLMTAIGKNQGFATIIGTTSGGGASSITPISLPNGTYVSVSSNNVLSIRIDNGDGTYTYQSIEHGITPDYELAVADTQNDAKIAEVIARALANQ